MKRTRTMPHGKQSPSCHASPSLHFPLEIDVVARLLTRLLPYREDKRMLVSDANGNNDRQTVRLKRSFQHTPEPADAAMKTEDEDAMMMDS